jgi:hypothetical protein
MVPVLKRARTSSPLWRALVALTGTWACVTADPRRPDDAPPYRPTWDFSGPERPVLLSLWPAQDEAPGRLKRHLKTNQHEGRLRLQVDGIDPAFIWQFEKPLHAGVFRVDLWSDQPNDVQLFWAGTRCPSFKEECSTVVRVPAERHTVEFMLPPEPLAELRLDFGQIQGLRLDVHALVVFQEPTIAVPWRSVLESTRVEQGGEGLIVHAADDDPWIVTDVPGLDASVADTIEVVIDAPLDTQGQLFWRGSVCPNFEERCSAQLHPMEAGATATSVDVSEITTWEGRIDGLRLDPGRHPGRYVVERIHLERVLKR